MFAAYSLLPNFPGGQAVLTLLPGQKWACGHGVHAAHTVWLACASDLNVVPGGHKCGHAISAVVCPNTFPYVPEGHGSAHPSVNLELPRTAPYRPPGHGVAMLPPRQ